MNKRTVINHLDPRAGLWLLLMANIGMFCQKNSEQGSMLSGIFLLLMLVHGPYLKEEFVHINAAMKLQNISWASRLECTVVPLIVSAVNTSDEIAAAAVARGIENPGKKTSEITLHMGISDWLIMILVTFGILIVVIAG